MNNQKNIQNYLNKEFFNFTETIKSINDKNEIKLIYENKNEIEKWL
jgi:hypothetical protein